jgi:hypothetical protein
VTPERLPSNTGWVAVVYVANRERLSPKPGGTEVLELRWCDLTEAAKLVRDTNRREKVTLVLDAIKAAAGRL